MKTKTLKTNRWSIGLHAKLGVETYLSDISGAVSQVLAAGTASGQSSVSAEMTLKLRLAGTASGQSAVSVVAAIQKGIAGTASGQSTISAVAAIRLGVAATVAGQSDVIAQMLLGIPLAGYVTGQSATISSDAIVNSQRVNWQFVSDAWNGEDAIDDVASASWTIGFSNPYDSLSRVSTFTAVLKNGDKHFSPENSQSPYFPNFTLGKLVRVQSIYQGVTRIHFLGWINGINPTGNTKGERKTHISVEGLLSRAQQQEVFIPVMEYVTGDEVLEPLLLESRMMPPGFSGKWLLGVKNQGELGTSTRLGSATDFLEAEVGVSTFTIIGDQWQDGVSVYGALRDIAGREGGKIHVNRDGRVVFWNRQHLLLDTTVKGEFDNSMSDMAYSYGDLFVNKVIVKARPRKIGTSVEVLGSLDKALKLKASDSKTVNFRYADTTNGAKISGKNIVEPVAGTDYTVSENEDGSGVNYTASVSANLLEEAGTRSRVTFTNNAGVDVWLQQGTRVRGIKITDWGEVDAYAEDADSISQFGPRPFTYPFIMDDLGEAKNLANFILQERQGPRGRVVSMTIIAQSNDELTKHALGRTVGDRIKIIENQTVLNANYFITSETHTLGESDYRVTWGVEPATVYQYWRLGLIGYSELGQHTILA